MQGLDSRHLGTSCKSPKRAPVAVSLPVLRCDWLHVSLAHGPCSSGSSVAASGLQKSAPAYEPCQQPAPATCLVVKPILNHQALPPTPSKGEARRIAKPPATIDNHQKLPSKLVCTRFCRAFRAASRQITPDLASFCVFSISPASLFPSLAAAHPTPPQPQPHPQPRAPPKHFDLPLVGRIASHRKAEQTCTKRPPGINPSAPRYTPLLSTRHGPFVHPSLDCTAPSRPFQFDTAQPGHALRLPSRRAPATSDSISYTSWSFVHLAVLVLFNCQT